MVSDFRPQESYSIFLQEAVEFLQEIEEGLLSIQTDHPPQKLNSLLRAAHSIKGGAACAGLESIQKLAYGLEKSLKSISTLRSGFDEKLESLLLQIYDALRIPLYEEVQYGRCQTDEHLRTQQHLVNTLEQYLEQPHHEHISQSLFANEIQHGITRWESILAQCDDSSCHHSLIAQAEIFRGLGEIANLEPLVAIANKAIEQLSTPVPNVQKIGGSALEQLKPLLDPVSNDKSLGHQQPSGNHLSGQREALASQDMPQSLDDHENMPQESEQVLLSQDTALASLSLGIRLSHARIEALNNQAAELVTQENQLLLHHQHQRAAIETVEQWQRRLYNINQSLHHCLTHNTSGRASARSISANSETLTVSQQCEVITKQTYSKIKDILLTLEEELVQVGESIQDIRSIHDNFQKSLKTHQKTVKSLQSQLLEARMLPIGEILSPFPRMVRDLCKARNKSVELEIIGSQTLVDRAIAEKIYDPLVHLVCNAFDHGIESPEIRESLNKPRNGKIVIQTYFKGNQVFIEVSDNGRGLSPEKIREKLIARHQFSPEEAEKLAPYQLFDYLFKSGFSTVEKADELSGRGMGLSSVKRHVEQLKGSIQIDSKPLQGTQFTLRFPLTLSVVKLLVFSLGETELSIPVDSLSSITVASDKNIQISPQGSYLQWNQQSIPIFSPQWINQYNYLKTFSNRPSLKNQEWRKSGKALMLLLTHREQTIALQIDQILMEQDLVIKPFSNIITAPPMLSGCTILGDGRLVPVLEGSSMIETWRQHQQHTGTLPTVSTKPKIVRPTILTIDDSLTLRDTIKMTLSKAGYRVLTAKDGSEGIEQLHQYEDIQCVISDIEMPIVNGLEFLSRARQSKSKQQLPIMMLTSRSSQYYRELADKLGANAYLTKPYIETDLLRAVESLLATS